MRQQVCKKTVLDDAVKFEFLNEDGTVRATHLVNMTDLSPEMQKRAALHGISQKLGDSYSGANGDSNLAEQSFNTTLKGIVSGDWNVRGEAGPRVTVLAEAVARVQGMDLSDAVEMVNGLTDEAKKTLRAHPAVKKASAAINLERAQARAAKTAEAEDGDTSTIEGLLVEGQKATENEG